MDKSRKKIMSNRISSSCHCEEASPTKQSREKKASQAARLPRLHCVSARNDTPGKAAFTFAELMIALIVISVLSAILYPTIAQFTPNNNKPLFKSAYRAFNEIINEIVNDMPDGKLLQEDSTDAITPATLCERFCNKANITATVTARDSDNHPTAFATDCIADCASESTVALVGGQNKTLSGKKVKNTITTSNGMRWKFDDYDSDTNMYYIPDPQNGTSGTGAGRFSVPVFKITVDVNASNNDLTQQWPGKSTVATIDRTFISNCTNNTHGKCGVFYFDNSTNANTGIYCHNTPTSCDGGGIPNIATSKPPRYENAHLKMQDTFEIYIDVEGKIIGMSPAAWANLENEYGN